MQIYSKELKTISYTVDKSSFLWCFFLSSFEVFVSDFFVVLFSALIATIFCQKLKLPPVIGLIFAGVLIGPTGFGFVKETELINIFAEIGAVLLLFYIGIEFDFQSLIQVAVKSVFFSLAKLLVVFVFIYEISIIFGLDTLTSLIVAFLLSITSTAIMIRILEQKGLSKKEEVKVLVTALIIEDIIAVIAITLVSSLDSSGFTLRQALTSVAFSTFLLGFAYFGLKKAIEIISNFFKFEENDESLLFFSLTLCMALSMIAFGLGLSAAIGAFLAGSLVSSLKLGHKAREITHPLGLAFSAVFFISIGILTSATSILSNIWIYLALLLAHIIGISLAVFFSARLIGFNREQSAFASMSMLVIGEFSLLFAKEAQSFSSIDLIGLSSVSILATTIMSSFFVGKSEKFLFFIKYVPQPIIVKLERLFAFSKRIIENLEYAGKLHRILLREIVETRKDLKKILFAAVVLVGIDFFFYDVVLDIFGYSISVFRFVAIVLFVTVLYSIVRVISSGMHLLDVFGQIIMNGNMDQMKKFERNLLIAFFFFALFIIAPILTDYLRLPSAFNWLRIGLFLPAITFAWIALTTIPSIHKKHIRKQQEDNEQTIDAVN